MKDKAILVIDMPDGCNKCEFGLHQDININYCKVLERYNYNDNIKLIRCPLKPMPEKSFTGNSDYFQWGDWEDGYNACIDEILGDN